MQLLFLDESGTPPKPGGVDPHYFVMGGVIIPERVWPRLRDSILGMKIRRRIRGELKWRFFSAANDKPGNPMRALSQDQRDDIRAEIYSIVCKERSIKSIAAICSIATAYKMASVTDQQAIYNLTYKTLTERFQYHLQDISRETGRPEYGMIICDHRGKDDDKRLRAHHQMLVHSVSGFTSQYPNLIESLLLQPSNLSIGIQLADIIAGAVWRKYEKRDDKWFGHMEPSLRRKRDGTVDGYGLVKVPKAGWI